MIFNVIKYILLLIILLIILFYLYFKITNQFWSKMPVFHYHNLKYWYFPPGIIDNKMPIINKYYDININFDNINNINNINKNKITDIIIFIRNNYENNENNNYQKVKKQNKEYNYCLTEKYFNIIFSIKNSFIAFKENNNLSGIITSRPIKCYFNNKNKLITNYIDFLSYNEKNLNEQLIYNLYYNCRNNTELYTFCFKKIGIKNIFVPLTTFLSYLVEIKYIKTNDYIVSNFIEIQEVNDGNINILYHFLFNIKNYFNCFLLCDESVLLNLIKIKYFKFYLIMLNKQIKAIYFFKETYRIYNNNKCIECCGSYNNGLDSADFYNLFLVCLQKIKKKKYDLCIINNISNNDIILNYFLPKYGIIKSIPISYYFINFGINSYTSNEFFSLV
jgi:hypothetical protein